MVLEEPTMPEWGSLAEWLVKKVKNWISRDLG
jgi:hypothetical protein